MSLNHNLAVTHRDVDEAWNRGNVDVYDESLADNYISHDPGFAGDTYGRDAVKQRVLGFRKAAPDLRVTLEDVVADGDKVVTRWRLEGTQDGALGTIPPTGQRVSVSGITIDAFIDGRIVESWSYWDTAGLMRQLGQA